MGTALVGLKEKYTNISNFNILTMRYVEVVKLGTYLKLSVFR